MKKMIFAVLFSAIIFAFGACASSAAVVAEPASDESVPVEVEVDEVEAAVDVDAEAAE